MSYLANATGTWPTSWTADILADNTFIGRFISVREDGVHRLRVKNMDGNLVSEKVSDHGQSFNQDEAFAWAQSQL